MKRATIQLNQAQDLQETIESHWRKGIRSFNLVGKYMSKKSEYSLLKIDSNLSGIALKGSNNAALDGNQMTAHVFVIENAKAKIEGLTLAGGDSTDASRLAKAYTGKKFRSIYEIIDGAGAVVTGNSSVKFTDCNFENNRSGMCGGAIANQSTALVSIESCLFEGNEAFHSGSAIDNLTRNSKVEIRNSKFRGNRSNAGSQLGGPYGQISIFPKTHATLSNCEFDGSSFCPIDVSPRAKFRGANNTANGKVFTVQPAGGLVNALLITRHLKQLFRYELHLLKHFTYPLVRPK